MEHEHQNKSVGQPELPNITEQVRASAMSGGAAVLGNGRQHALQEIGASAVAKFLRQNEAAARNEQLPVNKPRAWAFRVGRNEAWKKVRDESRLSELRPDETGDGDGGGVWCDLNAAQKAEVRDALPELFARFNANVIPRLEEEDRRFLRLYYEEKYSEAELASAFGITPKSVCQRWRRLVLKLRGHLLEELRGWRHGDELFGQAFRDPRNLIGLLRLIKDGITVAREIIEFIRPE